MKRFSIFILTIISVLYSEAHEITYRIARYNADAADFVMEAWGERPAGAVAYFVNEYGATSGNRFNQIPRNREAQLLLYGWEDCTINSITFSMCSNNKAGTVGFSVKDNEEELYNMKPVAFNSDDWFGQWVSKDLNVYVDITKDLELPTITSNLCTITVKGGTQEGSVYLNAITINYDAPEDMTLESPLGWVFEKLEKKSTLNEGDIIMLYRSGDAAADIDGMETSKYLDAIGISSTTNVVEPDVELFRINHDESGSHWTLTDQYNRQLGATGSQALAWDNGILTWDITLGYDGATIASTNSKYGTLRYNAPSGSYPRFWNYTSTSLALPYAYRRTRQLEPVKSTSIVLDAERSIEFGTQDTLVMKATVLPATTTDKRLSWTSSNPDVAVVNSGIVNILSVGETIITATALDGETKATSHITVLEASAIKVVMNREEQKPLYSVDGKPTTPKQKGIVINKGRKYLNNKTAQIPL